MAGDSRRCVCIGLSTISLAVTLLLVALLLIGVPTLLAPGSNDSRQVRISYDMFKQQIQDGNVVSIVNTHSTGDFIEGIFKRPTAGLGSSVKSLRFRTVRPSFDDPKLVELLDQRVTRTTAGTKPIEINGSGLPPAWDIVLSSGIFSTLSAVLAGFVFIAIIGILTIPPEGEGKGKPRPPEPLIPLLQSFVSLVLASFLWAVLAGSGTGQSQVPPLIEGFCISWIFALGVVQTSVGIVWVLKMYMPDEVPRPVVGTLTPSDVVGAGRWVVHIAIGLAAVSTAGVLTQSLYELAPSRGIYDAAAWFLIATPMVVVPIAWGLHWGQGSRVNQEALLRRLIIPTVISVVLITIVYQVITAVTPDFRSGEFRWYFFALLLAEFVLGALFTAYESSLPRGKVQAGTAI